ncbi:MAG: hypothetical protein K8R53_07080, partial [Bacteroidales bacterium]|nr:hypothetical protein [Bacteroidales bacterium]
TNLSGNLSHPTKMRGNFFYLGHLSRFFYNKESIFDSEDYKVDLLFVISGPEPQRTIFEERILDIMGNSSKSIVIVRGITDRKDQLESFNNVRIFNHLPSGLLMRYISEAGMIVCRPGYSSVMDLVTLGKSAVLVPTPGQTEQEYLAGYLHGKMGFTTVKQKNLKNANQLKNSYKSTFEPMMNDLSLIRERINSIF